MKLYPQQKPYSTFLFEVDKCCNGTPIKIFVSCYGNPKGYPVVYLHGGPGHHSTKEIARLYNLKKYNLIMFDQRGCGKSIPKALTENGKNTTHTSISDMEKIRKEICKTDKWLVTGGSWGTCLAVFYAQYHPKQTSGLILRGFVDLSTKGEFDNEAYKSLYPDLLDNLFSSVRLDYKKSSEKNMAKRLSLKLNRGFGKLNKCGKNKNNKTRRKIKNIPSSVINSLKLFDFDYSHSILSPKEQNRLNKNNKKDTIYDSYYSSRIYLHYILNNFFVKSKQMVKKINIDKIKNIPTIFVHGRFDVICPLKMAYEMHKQLNNSELVIVTGGHSSTEKEIGEALVDASNKMLSKLLKNIT